ncbi:MAG: hypothetical protein AVDCRST_MAG25-1894, partial [uncultured Rubrobacteraceae bacterium]
PPGEHGWPRSGGGDPSGARSEARLHRDPGPDHRRSGVGRAPGTQRSFRI